MAKARGLNSAATVGAVLVAGTLVLAGVVVQAQHSDPAPPAPAAASQDPHAPAADTHAASADQHGPAADGHAAPTAGHGEASHGAEAGHGESHGESPWVTLARVANFLILAGVIYHFGKKPLADHLATRGAQIRRDLVDAAQLRTTATERLAEIEARLAALPGELEQLRTRGAEELEAERTRMRAAAEAERDRLVEQARREIALQTRNASAQLRAEAAALATDIARQRLQATLTPAEQAALVNGYAAQMRSAQ